MTLRLVLVWLLLGGVALAHVGAPYVVLLDAPTGPYRLTVWADPDQGTGEFYLLPTDAEGQEQRLEGVDLRVRPADGHRPESAPVPGEPARFRDREAWRVRVPFDQVGPWEVAVRLQGPLGEGRGRFPVQVTPAGPGWLGWALGLGPCALLALLWWAGLRRSAPASDPASGQPPPCPADEPARSGQGVATGQPQPSDAT